MTTTLQKGENERALADSNGRFATPGGGRSRLPVWVAAVLLTLVVLQVPIFLDPTGPDSLAFAYGGWVIADGGRPYVDFVDNKPLGVYLVNAGVLLVAPRARESILVFEAFWILAATGVVFLLARRFLGSAAAKWAALLFVFTLDLRYLASSGNMTETWALLPVSLAYLAFFSPGGRRIPRFGLLLLTGALFGLAVQFRPTAGFPLIPLSGAVIVSRFGGSSRPGRFRAFLALWAGFAGVIAAVCALLAAWGALGPFLEFILLGNLHYVGSVGLYPVHRIFKALGYSGPALVLALVAVPRSLRSPDSGIRVLALCFLADLAGALLSRHWYGHYFIQPLVPAVILAVGLLGDLFARRRATGTYPAKIVRKQRVGTVLVAALSVFLLGTSLFEEARFAAALPARRDDAAGDIRLLNEAARYIAATTADNDLILCHGFGRISDLYFLSHRRAPTRFFHTHYLDRRKFGEAPWMDERAQQYLRDIGEHEPTLVIMPAGGGIELPEPYAGEFRSLLETRYRQDRDIGGFRILRRRTASGTVTNG